MQKKHIDDDSDIDLSLTSSLPLPEPKNIRIYPDVDVTFNYQNFGSAWLGILRGSSENIDLVFNGLYNHGATNGDYQFFDHAQTVAVFWTDYKAMRHFFFHSYFFPRTFAHKGPYPRNIVRYAMSQAQAKMLELSERCHEPFLEYSPYAPEIYNVGTIRAERPDSDFKDSVLTHAFRDKKN